MVAREVSLSAACGASGSIRTMVAVGAAIAAKDVPAQPGLISGVGRGLEKAWDSVAGVFSGKEPTVKVVLSADISGEDVKIDCTIGTIDAPKVLDGDAAKPIAKAEEFWKRFLTCMSPRPGRQA